MEETSNVNLKSRLEDGRIIELYWNRDEAAIGETDKKYHRYLYTIAYNIVHDDPDSIDCINDTYVEVWNRIPPTRPNVFLAFISKITRNFAIDRYRKNNALRRIPSEMRVSLSEIEGCIECSYDMEDELAVNQIVEILNKFLRAQSKRDAFMFVCRYYYADKISEIANMLEVGEATVFRALSRMRDSFRECLRKEGFNIG